MALANVALTDTFDTWRIRTNQLCALYDQTNTAVIISTTLSNAALIQSNAAFIQANTVYTYANTISGNAKAAFIQANAAYTRANTRLSRIEGTTGRIVTAANAAASAAGTPSYIVDLVTAGAGAATYDNGIASITIDEYGRVSSVVGSANYSTGIGFTPVQQGGGTGQGTNKVYIGWNSANSKIGLQVDSTSYANTWPLDISGRAAFSTLATKASTLASGGANGTGITFYASNPPAPDIQPGYVWGTNDGLTSFIWNPSNFSVNPAGTIIYFAGSTAPAGYLKANGAWLLPSVYTKLFAAIGYIYGAPVSNGVQYFALPDLRGVFPRGLDEGRGVDPAGAGRVIGSYQGDLYGQHAHGIYDPGHNHTTMLVGSGGYGSYSTGAYVAGIQGAVYGNGYGGLTSVAAGYLGMYNSGGAETRPRNVALLPCIKY